MRNRPILVLILLVVFALGLAAYSSRVHPGGDLPPEDQPDTTQLTPPAPSAQSSKLPIAQQEQLFSKYEPTAIHATLQVEGLAPIEIELYPKAAPKTVAHFVKLCKEGFYNGILFHRVIPNFVAQAGDPASKKIDGRKLRGLTDQQVAMKYLLGAGGSGQTVPFEGNDLTNLPGTIALALSAPRTDTGDSQFFINLVDNKQLDGDYCVFGRVVQGMDQVKKIQQGDRIQSIVIH
ncbi:peptidyl-prolyl cis-trans isomerase (rotamase)-cyclophilin family [Chthonomonas calidirosea]|uniref:Peptidyl-prolyl cis-trans isomerase n=1 Tax=Chthonomonas calidirosea (strain DSM 23976 / ICMP 18418 / T49) TaxID=1303518 RepID=S0EUG8_CHTCT|nr:peptidylprolyl isomerase [Chthonomonas calidirosea]CCW35335.1 Peptidyl-prolyl cis-trans isomerase (rotamase)-cyclophilin family [Chthonomonas calidirosea T49]CEK19601.1 peptidyl-prolyl cis-trans isomerase (rotamase)-cyclophilin family [Chthonomonas calidirosea]CEK20577.1 peptidyl-prolyl cis-trans isomerase (rotamase)-cyclophilin family [Chthonomonas calidirosea]